MNNVFTGIGVSRGVAIGPVYRTVQSVVEISHVDLPENAIEAEIVRFRAAVQAARRQLRSIRTRIPKATRADITEFIDAHLLMLDDRMLETGPEELIRIHRCNAEWALKSQRDALVAVFEQMDDPYLRTRKDDVDHVINRIMRFLLGQENHAARDDARVAGAIVVAHDLTPEEVALFQHQGVAGFVAESGGPLSHTAILTRSLDIPAVVGVQFTSAIHDGDTLVIDGEEGVVIADPDPETLKQYRQLQRREHRRRTDLKRLRDLPATTRDGEPISLNANIELKEDVRAARRVGADGIGLYRTEFLFLNRDDIPEEQEQLDNYIAVIRALKGIPLTIRTLDLGADKCFITLPSSAHVPTNPALGLRAIRLCLQHLDLFRPQLRAILRASSKGPIRIMIPMLSIGGELDLIFKLIDEIKRELREEGLAFDPNVPLGGMIEVPAAALNAKLFARRLDFLSIGTNDLIQYTLAIDRVDEAVTYLYNPLHPAVLRLIQMVIEAGKNSGVPVSMCGEMAGDTRYTRLLLGMGLTDFSVPPTRLLEVKSVINNTRIEALAPLVRKLLSSDNDEEIEGLLEELNRQ